MPQTTGPRSWLDETAADLLQQASAPLFDAAEAVRQQIGQGPVMPSFSSMVPSLEALGVGSPAEVGTAPPQGGWLSSIPSLPDLLGPAQQAVQSLGQSIQLPGMAATSGMSSAAPASGAPQPMPTGQPTGTFTIDRSSPTAFLGSFRPAAEAALTAKGYPTTLAPILAAIPMNEQGWQKEAPGSNYYGIKGSNPRTGANTGPVGTWEDYGAGRQNIQDTFRAYGSPAESVADFLDFLETNPRYAKAVEIGRTTGDPQQFIRAVHAAGYATDPAWSDKVLSIASTVPASPIAAPTQRAAESRIAGGELNPAAITQAYQGQPYVFGGAGGRSDPRLGVPTDCSGFVAAVWKNQYGLDLPAHTDTSYNQLKQLGAPEIAAADARPGDIVYYMGAGTGGAITHHMGIYSGPGRVLDMSVSGGDGVRERDIGHAGRYVILRDPRVNAEQPRRAVAPPEIVPSADSGGVPVVGRRQADALAQAAPTDEAAPRLEARRQDTRMAGPIPTLGMVDQVAEAPPSAPMFPQTTGATAPPVRDRWADDGTAAPAPAAPFLPGDGGTAPTPPPIDPDQGPREALPGSVGAQPIISPMSPQPEPVTTPSPSPSSFPNLKPVWDAAGAVVGYVQDALAPGAGSASTAPPEPSSGDSEPLAPPGSPYAPGQVESMTPPTAYQMPPQPERPWGPTTGITGPGGILEPAGGGARITSRLLDIQDQAAAELGRSPIDPRVLDDPGWRARHPDLAEEADELRRQLDLSLLGQVGDAARIPRSAPRAGDFAPQTVPPFRLGGLPEEFEPRVIPPHVVDQLDIPISVPTDPSVIRAIEAAGGRVDETGTTMHVIRMQGSEAAGGAATRGMPFFTAGPPGAPSEYAKATSSATNVGGPQRIEGWTKFRNPLIISAAPGEARGFDDAMRQLGRVDAEETLRLQDELARLDAAKEEVGLQMMQAQMDRGAVDALQRQYDDLSNRAADAWGRLNELRQGLPTADAIGLGVAQARRAGPEGSPARAQALKDLVARYGGDPDLIDDLLAIRGADASESAWAIKENILAGNARKQGRDAVITVQQQMSPQAYQDALEAAVQAHPRYQAQKANVSAAEAAVRNLEAERSSIPSRGGDLNRAYAQHDNAVEQARDALNDAYRRLDLIHDRLIDEVEVPVPSRISELADPRQARNPTPPRPTPELTAAYQRANSAKAALDDLYRGAPASEEAFQAAAREVEEANAALEHLLNTAAPPPGYALREDIPAAPGTRRSTIVENPTAAEAERAWREADERLDRFYEEYKAAQDRDPAANYYSYDWWAEKTGNAAAAQAKADEARTFAAYRDTRGEPRYTTAPDAPDAPPGQRLGAGFVPSLRAPAANFAQGAFLGGASESLQAEAEGREVDPRTMAGRALVGGVLGVGAGRAARGGAGMRLGSGVVPEGTPLPRRGPTPDLPPGARPITLTPEQEAGRLRLDLSGVPDDLKPLIQNAAQDANWYHAQRRGVLPDDVVERLAAAAGRDVSETIRAGQVGRAWSAEETVALRNAVAGQTVKVAELGEAVGRANSADAPGLIGEFTREAARLNDLLRVQEGARAEAGRSLRQWGFPARAISDPNAFAQAVIKKFGGDTQKALGAIAEYNQMVRDGATPAQLAEVWAKAMADPINASDVFALYRRFNMLSGPRTFEVNAISGASELAGDAVARAGGRLASGRPGEAARIAAAPLIALPKAARAFGQTFAHGITDEMALRGDLPRTMSAQMEPGVARAIVRVLETPDRINGATDAFIRTLAEQMIGADEALKATRGLSGEARNARVAELMANPTKEMAAKIEDGANRITFQGDLGALGQGLRRLQQVPIIGNVVLPFLTTVYHITARGIDRSPLGLATTAQELIRSAPGISRVGKGAYRAGIERPKGVPALSQRLRDNVVGTAAAWWAYERATTEDENGLPGLTGMGPDDPEKRAQLRALGWQPYSIRIGDQYWSYANLGPWAFPLAQAAAAAEARKYAKDDATTAAMIGDAAKRFASMVTEASVVSGIGAIVKATQDPDRYGGQWATQFLQSLIPAGSALNTIGQAMDPNVRRAERTDLGTQVAQGVEARLPPNPLTPDRTDVPIAQDPLGRDIQSEQTGLGALHPFRPTTVRGDSVIQAYTAAGVDIGKPKDTLTVSGTQIALTPAEQREWSRLRGEEITRRVGAEVGRDAWARFPADLKERRLKEALELAARQADLQIQRSITPAEIRRRVQDARGRKAS